MTIVPFDTITDRAFSSVLLSIGEASDNTGATPFFYAGGGINAFKTFGLGNYNALLIEMSAFGSINKDTNATHSATGIIEENHVNGKFPGTTAALLHGGNSVTSGCYTAIDSAYK